MTYTELAKEILQVPMMICAFLAGWYWSTEKGAMFIAAGFVIFVILLIL
jgi:hypothetical protein